MSVAQPGRDDYFQILWRGLCLKSAHAHSQVCLPLSLSLSRAFFKVSGKCNDTCKSLKGPHLKKKKKKTFKFITSKEMLLS